MRGRRNQWQSPQGWQRRPLVALALAAYLTSTVGIPLPADSGKQHGVAYPCQHHRCGCLSAAECWDHCCCYTPRQKLAWARENHVDPPARLVAQVAADSLHASAAEPPETKSICCARRATQDVSSHDHDDDHDACDHKACDHDSSNHDPRDHAVCASRSCAPQSASCKQLAPRPSGITFVPAARARQCRALPDLWSVSGAVLPFPASVTWRFQWNVVEWLALDPRPLVANNPVPPVPPPRI